MTPISDTAAVNRIYSAGITVAQALAMNDNDLLALPTIGRRTLAWIHARRIEERARSNPYFNNEWEVQTRIAHAPKWWKEPLA